MSTATQTALFDYPKYWAESYGTAPFLPMSRKEMDILGWDSCDIIIVTGDAYVDHPSFGMAIIGRMLESQGFRVVLLLNLIGRQKTTLWRSVSQTYSLVLPLVIWIQ
jgi:hypothetical protein